jgi:hypothetical protein
LSNLVANPVQLIGGNSGGSGVSLFALSFATLSSRRFGYWAFAFSIQFRNEGG